jgi:hypothetical protein
MNDALQANDNLRGTQRKIGYLALGVAWAAILATFFFYHEFGRKVTVQVAVMGLGALIMFIIAARTLSRTKLR